MFPHPRLGPPSPPLYGPMRGGIAAPLMTCGPITTAQKGEAEGRGGRARRRGVPPPLPCSPHTYPGKENKHRVSGIGRPESFEEPFARRHFFLEQGVLWPAVGGSLDIPPGNDGSKVCLSLLCRRGNRTCCVSNTTWCQGNIPSGLFCRPVLYDVDRSGCFNDGRCFPAADSMADDDGLDGACSSVRATSRCCPVNKQGILAGFLMGPPPRDHVLCSLQADMMMMPF